jgi:hypothetical protein
MNNVIGAHQSYTWPLSSEVREALMTTSRVGGRYKVVVDYQLESFTGVGLIEMTTETLNALMMRLLPESEK